MNARMESAFETSGAGADKRVPARIPQIVGGAVFFGNRENAVLLKDSLLVHRQGLPAIRKSIPASTVCAAASTTFWVITLGTIPDYLRDAPLQQKPYSLIPVNFIHSDYSPKENRWLRDRPTWCVIIG